MTKTVFYFLFFFSFSTIYAQLPKVIHFNESSGFRTARALMDIQVDSEGYLWIISLGKITKYDGKEFIDLKSKTHIETPLRFKEANKKKYVINMGGNVFFIQNDSIVPYEYNYLIDSLKKHQLYFDHYFDKRGRFHFTTAKEGYCIIDKGKVIKPIHYNVSQGMGNIVILRKDKLPFLTRHTNGKVIGVRNRTTLLDDKFNIIDTVSSKWEKGFYPQIITKLKNKYVYWDGLGNLISMTKEKILKVTKYNVPITGLTVDKQNNLWISTDGDGIHLFKNGEIDLTKRKIFFKSQHYSLSTFDDDGGAWIISNQTQLKYIPSIHFKYYDTEGEQAIYTNFISNIRTGGDSIFIVGRGTDITIFNERNNETSLLLGPNSRKNSIIQSYYDKKNKRVWVSLRGEVFYLEDKKWRSFILPKQISWFPYSLISFFETPKKSEYSHIISFENRLLLMKDTIVSKVVDNPKIEGRIRSIRVLRDTTFLFTSNDALYSWVNDSINILNLQYKEHKLLPAALYIFDQSLYIFTRKDGVFRFINNKWTRIVLPNKSLELTSWAFIDSTSSWLFSEESTLKITFDTKGIKKKNTSFELLPSLTELFIETKTLSGKNGLYAKARDNRLLFIPYETIESQKIEQPEINRFSFAVKNTTYTNLDSNYEFNYDQNFVRFDYQLISLKGYPVSYRYRLNGLDEDWTNSKENQVRYINLQAGDYEFEVQARKGKQIWSHPKKLSFSISPPFWKTWWFVSISCIIIIGITYWILKNRIKIANREKTLLIGQLISEQKALRAKMDPHFIFNIVSTLQYFVLNKKNKKAARFLEQFSSLMRNTLDQTNQEFNTIENEISFLKEYLEIEKLRLEDKFNYDILVDQSVVILSKIPNFLIQPFVENAIEHGLKNKDGKGYLKIRFTQKNDYLMVVIEDDGVGYNRTISQKTKRDRKHNSQGISIVQRRLQLEEGNSNKNGVIITDLSDLNQEQSGTRVNLSIRVQK